MKNKRLKFYLRSPYFSQMRDKNGDKVLKNVECAVYLYVTVDSKNIVKIAVGEKYFPKDWDLKAGLYKGRSEKARKINGDLEKFALKYSEKLAEIEQDPTLSSYEIKQELEAFSKGKKATRKTTFIESFKEFTKTKEMAARTVQKYETIIAVLEDFQRDENYKLTFDSINLAFYEKFVKYLRKMPARGKMKTRSEEKKEWVGLLDDTISKYIAGVKSFMRWSYDNEMHESTHFMKKSFSSTVRQKNGSAQKEIVALTLAELKKFYKHDFSNDKKLERVRDLFCFMAFTGLRWSDAVSFDRKQLVRHDDHTAYRLNLFKTENIIEIPFVGYMSPAYDILLKYGYELPVITAQKFNKYIKQAGEKAKLKKPIIIKRKVGIKTINIEKPLYDHISSHTARRTFVSILLNDEGKTAMQIKQLTGHTNTKQVEKYFRGDQKALVESMSSTKGIKRRTASRYIA